MGRFLGQTTREPTRGDNILDRLFVSSPTAYSTVRVVKSTVLSDHKAIVAYNASPTITAKTTVTKSYRRVTPAQHALLLQHLSSPDLDFIDDSQEPQHLFNQFYNIAYSLLDQFYPIRSITVTSRDPDFVTPDIKAMLRRKNRLMRAGRVEEAGALAERIGKAVTRRSKKRLCRIDRQHGAKAMWEALRQMTGRRQNVSVVDGVSADSLNEHYSPVAEGVPV